MGHFNDAVFGVYKLNSQIANAQQRLLSDGFYNHEFDVLYPERASHLPERVIDPEISIFQRTQIKLFSAIGAGVGGVLFSTTAWLMVFGVIPHVHVYTNADLVREVMIVFMGLMLGMLYGAVSGALVGIGTSRKTGQRYGHYLNSGQILMSVSAKTDKHKQLAYETLSLTGAQDICTAGESRCWQAVREAANKVDPAAPNVRQLF